MRSVPLLLAKLAVGAVLFALIVSHVPFHDASHAIEHLRPETIALAIGLYFAAHAINALKLRVFLPELSPLQAARFTLIALFYGAALPGQIAGDAVKALRLIRLSGGGDAGRVAAAVALDKVVGLFALLVLTALGLGLEAGRLGVETARAATAVVALAAAGLAALMVLPPPAWLGRWGQTFRLWRDANVSAGVMSTALALGLVFNALSIAVFVVLGDALGVHVSLAIWTVVVGFLSLALLLPISLAGIGLRDASLVLMLTTFGQSSAAALALSLSLLVLTVIGAAAGLAADLIGRDKTS